MRKAPNMPTVECPHGCGKTGYPGPIALHAKKCSGRLQDSPTPPPREARPATIKREKPPKALPTFEGEIKGFCDGCPGAWLRGMNVAEIQVVETGVMAGLSIEAATKIVRQAQAARS